MVTSLTAGLTVDIRLVMRAHSENNKETGSEELQALSHP